MSRKTKHREREKPAEPQDSAFKVEDRRHWAVEGVEAVEGDEAGGDAAGEPAAPTLLDEYRRRTEEAERKLQEYIGAFKSFQREQEEFRERLQRDVDRRVELQFGELLRDLLDSVDDLDLAVEHADGVSAAAPLARGVAMARDRLLAALERRGVERLAPDATAFDPHEAEAVRVDPVEDEEADGKVTETLRPGYRLGELVIRPARVAVGRYAPREPGADPQRG